MSLTETQAVTIQSNNRRLLAERLQDLFFSQRSLRPRHWFLSTAITCLVLPATSATVGYGQQSGGPVDTIQPLNRIGRVLGIGYSDGYHAGHQGQSNLLLDLPPRSLWADPRYNGYSHGHHQAMTHGAMHASPAWFQPHVHQGHAAVDPYAEAITPIETVETYLPEHYRAEPYQMGQPQFNAPAPTVYPPAIAIPETVPVRPKASAKTEPPRKEPNASKDLPTEEVPLPQGEPSPSDVLPDPLIDDKDKSEADSSAADPLSGSLLPTEQADPLLQEQSLEKTNTLESPKAGGSLLLEPDTDSSSDPLNDFTMNRRRQLRFPSPAATLSNTRLQNAPNVTPPPAPAARQPRTASRIAEPSPVPK